MEYELDSFINSKLLEKQIDLDKYDVKDRENFFDVFRNLVSVYGKENFVKTVDFVTDRSWHKSVDSLRWNYLFSSVCECFRDIPDTDTGKLERMRNFDYFKYFKLTSGQMRFLTDAVKYDFDFKPYINHFGGNQLAELAEGLKKGLDVSSYAHPEMSCEKMKYIRQSLEGKIKSNDNEFVDAVFVDNQSQLEKHDYSQSYSNDDRVIVGNVFQLEDGLYKIVFDENKLLDIPRKSFFQMRIKKKFVPEGKSLPDYRSPFYVYYNKSGIYLDDIYVRANLTVDTNLLCDKVPSQRNVNYLKGNINDIVTIFMKWAKDLNQSWKYDMFYFEDEVSNNIFGSLAYHKDVYPKFENVKLHDFQEFELSSPCSIGNADFCTEEYIRHCFEQKNKNISFADDDFPLTEFVECQQEGYRARTLANASADVTIALAIDFNTTGEKLTASAVENHEKEYIAINISDGIVSEADVNRVINTLNSVNAKSINIAGNGMQTLKRIFNQKQVDDIVFNLLLRVNESSALNNKIELIRSGGQTGVDEAGIKAAILLSIPNLVYAPKGWLFRTEGGRDIADEKLFKARFVMNNIKNNVNQDQNLSHNKKAEPSFNNKIDKQQNKLKHKVSV